MIVAIRSYRRAATIAEKTLPELARLGVDPTEIRVFLSDPSERDEYAARIADPGVTLVDGAPGCGPNGNFIHHYYPEGSRVIAIDDDVRSILIRRNEKTLEPISPVEFREVVDVAWSASTGGLWGIHPVPNAYFQRPAISRDLRYICGGFYGFTSRHEPWLDVSLEDKEDFERSIKWYLADGYVTRLNWISMRTAGYSGKGGMQEARTPERVAESARILAARYPHLAKLNETKRSGWAEVRLRDSRYRVRR